jgi:hypothetical protein
MAKEKYMCVYCLKSRVGRSALLFFFFFIVKIGNSRSGIRFRNFIFKISGKPSFVLWWVTQFFYLLCSQFRLKASGWINKTLLLMPCLMGSSIIILKEYYIGQKKKYVCLRSPDPPYFSAADPNLFYRHYSTLIFANNPINFYTEFG